MGDTVTEPLKPFERCSPILVNTVVTPTEAYIYNICDHEACYAEVGSQAISYTTGVPAMVGAMMLLTGKWNKPGVYTVEEFDPDPYMDALNQWGLPWQIDENPVLVD